MENTIMMWDALSQSVFKNADGKAWDTEAVIHITEAGYIFPEEKHCITFPHTPKVELIRQS